MKVKILGYSGIRSGEFNGHQYTNRKLSYVLADGNMTPRDYKGNQAGEIKIGSSVAGKLDSFNVGDIVNITYNRWGQVEDILSV